MAAVAETGAITAQGSENALESSGARPGLIALLRAYRDASDLVDRLPPVVLMPQTAGRFGRHVKLPRFRWFVRPAITFHVTRSIDALTRYAAAAAALDDAAPVDARDIALLDDFGRSLRPVSVRRAVTFVVVGGFLGAFAIAKLWHARQATFIGHLTQAIVELDRKGAIRAFDGIDLLTVTGAVLISLLALWVILLLPAMAFRVKRAAFNLCTRSPAALETSPAAEHAEVSAGVYELERQVFGTIGGRAPREVPLDLIEPALLIATLAIVGGVAIGTAPSSDMGVAVAVGCWCFSLAAACGLAVARKLQLRLRPTERFVVTVPRGHWPRRLGAWAIDALVLLGLAVPVALVTPVKPGYPKVLLCLMLVAVILTLLVNVRGRKVRCATLGHRAMGLRVVSAEGRPATPLAAAIREGLLKWGLLSMSLLVVPLLIDVTWAIWDPDNRCLHDVATGTRVMHRTDT
jgi:uncharacterized RDD family membrane protein YckC